MENFSNPLDGVKVASPCPANWNEMQGDERRRYCSECKLNVYNLSEMTRAEAENFVLGAEGRVCVKFYRRADGSLLTKDCPVGWRAFKKRASRAAKAFLSISAGILGGVFAFNQLQPKTEFQDPRALKVSAVNPDEKPNSIDDFKLNSPSEDATEIVVDGLDYTNVVGMLVVEEPQKKANSGKKRR